MSEESRNPTFRIDRKDQSIYRELTGSEAKGETTIRTMKDVFLMSAAIGINNKKQTPLPRDTAGPFR